MFKSSYKTTARHLLVFQKHKSSSNGHNIENPAETPSLGSKREQYPPTPIQTSSAAAQPVSRHTRKATQLLLTYLLVLVVVGLIVGWRGWGRSWGWSWSWGRWWGRRLGVGLAVTTVVPVVVAGSSVTTLVVAGWGAVGLAVALLRKTHTHTQVV